MNLLLIERVIDYLALLLYLGGLFHFDGSVDSELLRLGEGSTLVVIYVAA